jgi:hypothetical protein
MNRVIVLAIAASGLVCAQEPAPGTPGGAPPLDQKEGPRSQEWKGLSVKEKLKYDWIHLFDVQNVAFAGVGAGFDQLRNRPSEWGQGGDAFGERYASHLGFYAVQRSIMFPVQAIDHEDTRYFQSTHHSVKRRIGDALLETVWRYNDDGEKMPAYSEFLGDYGAAAVSRLWWPARYRTGSSIFVAGSDTILVDAGVNVLREFTPDLKRLVHRKK